MSNLNKKPHAGSLSADFAGTEQEARQFCQANPTFHVGHYPNIGNEGLPMIVANYHSKAERVALLTEFDKLGWPEEAVGDKVYA